MTESTISHRKSSENGIVFIEFAMAFSLLLLIVLGMAQQYMVSLNRIYHYSLATEVLMGPQERSVAYDPSTGLFSALSGSTTPTDIQFLDTVGNFLLSRFPNSNYAAYLQLAYFNIDPDTGEAVSANTSSLPASYVGATATGCDDTIAGGQRVSAFVSNRTSWALANLAAVTPTSEDDDRGRFGIKLYDFRLGDTRYRQYEDVFPLLFLHICSSPINIRFSQAVHTYHIVVPRRHIN